MGIRAYVWTRCCDDEAETFHPRLIGSVRRMIATPALTQAGRAAKVRALLADILGDQWRGATDELDWDIAKPASSWASSPA